jgi:hypothetical protein
MPTPPELDLARIARYCAGAVPVEHQDQVRIEMRRRGNTVTIVECRPPWPAELGPEWSELPQARMKYDATTRGWTLYWFDRNSKAHLYDLIEPSQPVAAILAEVQRDPTAIFWG